MCFTPKNGYRLVKTVMGVTCLLTENSVNLFNNSLNDPPTFKNTYEQFYKKVMDLSVFDPVTD